MSNLTPNELAFIALCNEFCAAAEHAAESTPAEFVAAMTRILPRIYISAADLNCESFGHDYIDPSMDEDQYEVIRSGIAALLGAHDTYLEVFEEDMKFSDTPIAASIAEGLADLTQVFYNFVEVVRDAPDELIKSAVAAVAEDFRNYWSRILCNQLRALNALNYSGALEEDEY